MQRHRPRHLYFIRHADTSYYKIGIASEVTARLSGLQTGNPFKLTVIKTFEFTQETSCDAEQKLHEKFETHAVHGEWFSFTEQNLEVALLYAEELERSSPKPDWSPTEYLGDPNKFKKKKFKQKAGRFDPANWRPGDPMGVSPPPFKKIYWHDGYLAYLKARGLPKPSEDWKG